MNKKAQAISDFLIFYSKAEKLKSTLRHCRTSDKTRQESTAEHSWMLGLMVIVLSDVIPTKVDKLKTLKMVLIHDLAEAITGDIPAFEKSARQRGKHTAEKKALSEIVSSLPKKSAQEIIDLWLEYEAYVSPEAKFGHSLDKIEALLQHNATD